MALGPCWPGDRESPWVPAEKMLVVGKVQPEMSSSWGPRAALPSFLGVRAEDSGGTFNQA